MSHVVWNVGGGNGTSHEMATGQLNWTAQWSANQVLGLKGYEPQPLLDIDELTE